LGKAVVLREVSTAPLVLLSADAPSRGSAGAKALEQVTGAEKPIRAVIEMLEQSGLEELQILCEGEA
jgi:hypothetical protein